MSMDIEIDLTTQGTIKIDPNGSPINVIDSIDVGGFYTYLVEQLKSLNVVYWPPGCQ